MTAPIIDLYRSGLTIRQVCAITGRSFRAVRSLVAGLGIVRRPGRKGPRPFHKGRKLTVEQSALIHASTEPAAVLATRYSITTQRVGQIRRA